MVRGRVSGADAGLDGAYKKSEREGAIMSRYGSPSC